MDDLVLGGFNKNTIWALIKSLITNVCMWTQSVTLGSLLKVRQEICEIIEVFISEEQNSVQNFPNAFHLI